MTPLEPAFAASRRPPNTWWVALAPALAAVALLVYGPIAQPESYHAFADDRPWFGLPNAANVLSNLPFLAAGAWGLWRLGAPRRGDPVGTAWRLFCIALACTAFGSSAYHLAPANPTLVFDRLPIAWACAVLLLAFLGERLDPRWCAPAVLAGGLVIASLSVAWWWFTESPPGLVGDLRPYLYVQFLPLLVVPLVIVLRPPGRAAWAAPDRGWWVLLAAYAVAKTMEYLDRDIYRDLLATVSGHTLKHLFAAAGAAWLLGQVAQARAGRTLSSGSRR